MSKAIYIDLMKVFKVLKVELDLSVVGRNIDCPKKTSISLYWRQLKLHYIHILLS